MKQNIFQYTNYREFLKDFCADAKVSIKGFSHRYFALKAGFNSSGFLSMVIEGRRNLTKDFVPKFAQAMSLTKKEAQYFDVLVSFNQADTPESKRYYLELLQNLKKEKVGSVLSDWQFEYFRTWYYTVIRELVALPSFVEDAKWIRKQLHNKVSIIEVKDAIDKLLKLGLIKRDENNRLIQSEASVATEDEVHHTAVYSFHQEMIALSREIISKTYGEQAKLSGITMPVSKKQFKEIKDMINNFEHEIMRYLTQNPDVPETVGHINIHFFPIIAGASGGQNE